MTMGFASPRVTTARVPRGINWGLASWWMVVNAGGVFIAVVLLEIYSEAHHYNPPSNPWGELLLLLCLVALGVLQALAGSVVISFVRMHHKAVRIALGVMLGVIAAILALMLGMTFLWIYAMLGFWVFLPSGILFGWLLARSTVTAHTARQL